MEFWRKVYVGGSTDWPLPWNDLKLSFCFKYEWAGGFYINGAFSWALRLERENVDDDDDVNEYKGGGDVSVIRMRVAQRRFFLFLIRRVPGFIFGPLQWADL